MKVVFSDMDGTLLNNDHKVSEYTVEMVGKLRATGVRFVLASGRPSATMLPFHKQLGLSEPLICCNGAMVIDGDEIVEFFPIASDIVKQLIELSKRLNVYGQFYNYGRLATFEYHRGNPFLALYEQGYHAISGYNTQFFDEATASLESVSKWMYIGEHEVLKQVKQVVLAELSEVVDVAFSHPYYLEVVAKGVNKGRAAQSLLKKWGMDVTEAGAFGDEANDRELLTLMGHGYVMKNGIEDLKQIVKHITPFTNDEDGVAKVLAGLIK